FGFPALKIASLPILMVLYWLDRWIFRRWCRKYDQELREEAEDAVQSRGHETSVSVEGTSRISKLAVVGAFLASFGVMTWMMIMMLMNMKPSPLGLSQLVGPPLVILLMLLVPALIGTRLGYQAMEEIRKKRPEVYGLRLACFNFLLLPLL